MSNRIHSTIAFFAILLLFCLPTGAQEPTEEAPPDIPEVEQLLNEIDALRAESRLLQDGVARSEGEEQTLVVLQMRKVVFDFMRTVNKLVANIISQKEEGGVKRPHGLNRARKLLLEMDRTIPKFIDGLEDEMSRLRTALSDETPEPREDLEIQVREIDEILDEGYPFFFDHLEHRESLGLKASDGRKQLGTRASARASMLEGRVGLLGARRTEARNALKETPEDAELARAVRDADENLDEAASSLWVICDVMDDLGLDTADHRKTLIQITGEVSGDILNWDVMLGLFDDAADAVSRWLERRATPVLAQLVLFFAIIALFWVLGGVARWFASRMADRAENVSELSRRILVTGASRIVVTLGFFIALAQVGVDVTALVAGLGIVGFIVGFALQNTLGDFASGTMILIYRPFDVGDTIEAGGVFGQVDSMSLVSTTILTFDNQTLVVPNTKIWGNVIRNVTARDIRRVDLEFGFSHAVDITRAEKAFSEILSEHPKILHDPEPMIKIHKVTDLTTRIIMRPWVKREDYWDVYWDLTRETKLRLDREGIPMGLTPQSAHLPGVSLE